MYHVGKINSRDCKIGSVGQETGFVNPQTPGGSPPRKLQEEQLITLIEIIEKAAAKLIYLSPYSPEFSPIENFWSKVKANLKKVKPRNYKDLINAITDSMLKVTKEDIRNWFAHCCYCTS
jgi:DDE superfamily endonuclease